MTPNTPTPAATAPAGQVHTATPWARTDVLNITADHGRILVARVHGTLGKTEPEIVNADFIVEACNAHATLIARVIELEEAIRTWACECGDCNFGEGATGFVEVDGVKRPCNQCADIRALFSQVQS